MHLSRLRVGETQPQRLDPAALSGQGAPHAAHGPARACLAVGSVGDIGAQLGQANQGHAQIRGELLFGGVHGREVAAEGPQRERLAVAVDACADGGAETTLVLEPLADAGEAPQFVGQSVMAWRGNDAIEAPDRQPEGRVERVERLGGTLGRCLP